MARRSEFQEELAQFTTSLDNPSNGVTFYTPQPKAERLINLKAVKVKPTRKGNEKLLYEL